MYLFRATPILRETSNSLISGGQTFDTYIVSSVTSRGSFWGYQQPSVPRGRRTYAKADHGKCLSADVDSSKHDPRYLYPKISPNGLVRVLYMSFTCSKWGGPPKHPWCRRLPSPLRVPGRPLRPPRPTRLCEFVADVQLHFVPGIWDVTHLLIWKILMRQPVPAELASMPMRQLGHSGSTSLKLTRWGRNSL